MVSILQFVMYVSFFSMAWFILGITVGRTLPRLRLQKPGDPSSRRKGNGGGGSRSAGPVEIYVGNLPYDVSEKELYKTFKVHGAVASARVIANRFTGKSRGFGFVEMDDRREAEAAIRALNGKDIRGRKIVVNEAK